MTQHTTIQDCVRQSICQHDNRRFLCDCLDLASIAAEIAECGADLLQYTERLFPQAGAIGVQYLPAAYPSNRRFELR